ncbi:SLC13 family permease [Ruegeria halocynthiae]|uniref:SLC13 family permease n=1 Tax=Ruegeria halocynthiae TaxID=985054 RepID=UPI00056B3E7A|nr:SLC13 family permease [Ruegeria halocynthiae]
METLGLTFEMVVVLGLLGLTIVLFVSEIVRVDIAAILIMVALGLLTAVPGLESLVDVRHLFDGFASNAVISIIAVMIIGAGLDRTGVMSSVAAWITKVGGATENRIIVLISGAVGVISSFMQNVGAAALFLPVVSRVSTRTGLPMSRLLMPMGFCAILGGTMTMVGSSPLILLNDLIASINGTLPAETQIDTFSLFSVTPVGICLLITGLLYFIIFGRFVLPTIDSPDGTSGNSTLDYVNNLYQIDGQVHEIRIPEGSKPVGRTIDDLQRGYHLQIIATHFQGHTYPAPPRNAEITAPATIAVIADENALQAFLGDNELTEASELDEFVETLGAGKAGIAEVVIPPGSKLIGKTGRELWLRKVYGLSPLAIYRGGETLSRDQEDLGEIPYLAGDTLVCHTAWDALARLEKDSDFVVVTTDFPHEDLRPKKIGWALLFFLIAVSLILFSDLRLSLCLLVGAIGMVVSRVLSMDEAYNAVSWPTVFLLASLIPLGQAVQASGTAAWIADQVLAVLDGMPIWVIQTSVAVLATFFTLVMSNVGATVLLVPLAVNIALGAGADPGVFALTVAIATSNSFLIPTHQVNALLMGPGGYRVVDFMKAGGIMTILFLIVAIGALNLLW